MLVIEQYHVFWKEWGWYLLQELNDLLVKGAFLQIHSEGSCDEIEGHVCVFIKLNSYLRLELNKLLL